MLIRDNEKLIEEFADIQEVLLIQKAFRIAVLAEKALCGQFGLKGVVDEYSDRDGVEFSDEIEALKLIVDELSEADIKNLEVAIEQMDKELKGIPK